MKINMLFVAKSVPAILVLGGILFILLDQIAITTFGIIGTLLVLLGIILSFVWPEILRKF